VRFVFYIVLFLAAVVAPTLVHLRAKAAWRAKDALLQKGVLGVTRLNVENSFLSGIVTRARGPQTLSQAQLSELLRLRSEVGQLASTLNQTNLLEREIAQLRDGIQDLRSEKETSEDAPTALFGAQTELRAARLAKLRQWLTNRPKEIIPELQLLSENSWQKSAEWTRVTDEEYASWMSAQRGNAELGFSAMAFKALKEYAAANNGNFPKDLSELKPYFETPAEESMLERYHVVPAKSLPLESLQRAGQNWVITQKAPVNRKYDTRIIVDLKAHGGTLEEGRWDDVPEGQ